MDAPIEGLTLNCAIDGEAAWEGDVFCKDCKAIFLCTGVVEEEGRKKHVYPDAPPKGVCSCGKRLFGGTDFTARPMCHGCAVRVTTRKAAERGEILWRQECPHGGVKYPENFNDYADPDGCHTYELWTCAMNKTGLEPCDKWHWSVDFPEGQASGEVKTQEEARAWAKKIYLAVVKP